MSENKAPAAAAGGWVITTTLRDGRQPEKLHTVDELRAIVTSLALVRRTRGEPAFDNIDGRAGEGAMAQVYTLYGISKHDVDTTKKMLFEIAAALGHVLGHDLVEGFVAGQRIEARRITQTAPGSVTLN